MHYLFQRIKAERGNLVSIATTSLVSVAASFIMMLAFANLLDQRTLGIYQYIIATASIIGAFSFTGMGIAIIRAVGKKSYNFLPTARRYLWYGSLLPVAIGTIGAGYYAYKTNYELALGIFFSVICITITQVLMRHNSIYVAIEQFKASNYLLKAHVLAPVIFVLPALFFLQNAGLLAVLYFGGSLVAVLCSALLLKMPQREQVLIAQHTDQLDTEETKKENSFYLRFATHQSVINAMNSSVTHLDKILIFQMLGAQQTAIYYIATSLPNRIRTLIKQFEPYLFSKFSKYELDTVVMKITIKFIFHIILTIPFIILYVLFAPIFFKIFLSQYTDSINLTLLYSISLFASASMVPYATIKAHASSLTLYKFNLTSIVIRISLLFFGILFYGLVGAIIATIISLLVTTIIAFFTALNLKRISR